MYYPHLLMLAALVLFVAIVSPVVLSFISYSPITNTLIVRGSNNTVIRRQNIFLQTLRLSVDRNFY